MASPPKSSLPNSSLPKSSLVERLMQDRLRSGELEASAAQLLQVGEGAPIDALRLATPDAPSGAMRLATPDAPSGAMRLATPDAPSGAGTGDAGMNLLVRPLPIIALRSTSLPETAPLVPVPLVPDSIGIPDRIGPDLARLNPIGLGGGVLPPQVPIPHAPVQTAAIPSLESGLLPHQALPPLASTGQVSPSVNERGHEPAIERSELPPGAPSIDAVALERGGMVDWSRTRSRISEEFRLVQRQILRSAFGPGAEPGFSNLLLVTSARPGEGKSFTSLNLAGSIARQGDNHVLLIDADSKRDSVCYALGLAENRGLLDLVANPKLDPSPLIVKTPIDRLSILPVGRERERSAELFSAKEMTRLIQSLGRRYADRLLILDAPPCLSTSDPAVLAPVVGQILFVVEADRTQRDEVEASLDLIQACQNITLVLNKQQISSRYTFGAYSSYYSS